MSLTTQLHWFTPIATIVGGVIIFVVGQAVLKLFIEPVQNLKGTIGSTSNTLLRHQAKITNGMEDAEISAKIYDHAAELVSKAEVIICYRFAALVFRLPSRVDVLRAARELNAIGQATMDKRPSTTYGATLPSPLAARNNHDSLKHIAKLLRVKTAYS